MFIKDCLKAGPVKEVCEVGTILSPFCQTSVETGTDSMLAI
jgi:hypothetical protein